MGIEHMSKSNCLVKKHIAHHYLRCESIYEQQKNLKIDSISGDISAKGQKPGFCK